MTNLCSDGLNDVAIMDSVTAALPAMAAEDLPNNPANGIDVPMSDDPVCGYFSGSLTYDPCSLDGKGFNILSCYTASDQT